MSGNLIQSLYKYSPYILHRTTQNGPISRQEDSLTLKVTKLPHKQSNIQAEPTLITRTDQINPLNAINSIKPHKNQPIQPRQISQNPLRNIQTENSKVKNQPLLNNLSQLKLKSRHITPKNQINSFYDDFNFQPESKNLQEKVFDYSRHINL